nr:reverse transcriptase domain-containing protein [Tanacetum cinerariifolium]
KYQEDPPPEVSMADNRTMAELLQAPPRDRFNDLLRACPHHGFFELHQLDTFYNALNVNDHDSFNSTAGGNFLDKMPRECLKIIESKSKVSQSRAKAVVTKVGTSSSTPAISFEVAELKDLVRALLLDKKNQSLAPVSSPTPALVKAVEPNYVTCGGSGTLPSNTITNPKEELKVQTPSSQSTAPVQPPVSQSETPTPISELVVAPVSILVPNVKSSIPYPSRRDNERRRDQANEQIEKFYKIFKDMSFEISFTDALILMPKFASTLIALIGNKEKLSEMARTPMNEHCSVVILKKLPRKFGDLGKFLIPCEFPGMD